MRRCFNGVIWLWSIVVLGVAGCSGEAAPPLLAISSQDDERPKQSDTVVVAAAAGDVAAQAAEPGRLSPARDETADEAVRAVIRGLQQGQPDALWDALPASYQRDLNDLVHMAASRLNPEAWRWFLRIAGKGAAVVRSHRKNFLIESSPNEDDEQAVRLARALERLAVLLERFSQSGPGLFERMKTADVGELLRADGRALTPLCSTLLELIEDVPPQLLQSILQASVSVKDSAVDSAVLELRTPDANGTQFEFVRVEGKWIPRCLADGWTDAIGVAKQAVRETLPSETASDNFGRTFQALAAIDFSLDVWLWQTEHPGVNPHSNFDDVPWSAEPSMMLSFFSEPLILLGDLLGGPPTIEPDFHQKTKKTLEGKNKVTLVYCYASKELKWDHESLDFDLAKHVAYQLISQKIRVVDPDRVYAWLDTHDRWRKTAEIGAAFKADFIVHIDVKDYSLNEANVNNLYRGRADCIVNVVEMDENKKDGRVIYTTPIKSNFPTNGPVDQSAMPYAEFKKRYLSALSYEIGKRFFSTETGDDIPYGMLQQ